MSIWNELYEDKKCRICGLADLSNVNIFQDKILRMKIITVYPIVLHEDDPLPKNICRKCISSVSSMYNDVQRVVKLQMKWAENVRINEPENDYLQALSFLENATTSIKSLMKASFGTVLSHEAISHFITSALGKDESPEKAKTATTTNTFSLNGEICNNLSIIKSEPITEDEKDDLDDLEYNVVKSKKSCSFSTTMLTVMCRYCPLQFESMARLALHQNVHLKLQIPKLYQTKYLSKKSRRGRLISVNGSQSIRCLNCWRIFNDNKCILEHWSNAECTFYCQICGEEFEQSPKMLREHVLVDHGVSYKSLKLQRDQLTRKTITSFKIKQSQKDKKDKQNVEWLDTPQKKIKTESPKSMEKVSPQRKNELVICRICSRAFQNFKACNSHMRAHKPPYAYGETATLPSLESDDAYTEFENKEEDENHTDNTLKSSPQETSSEIIETVTRKETGTATSSCIVYNMEKPKTENTFCSSGDTKKYTSQIIVDSKAETLCSNGDTKTSTFQITADSKAAKLPSTAPRGIRMKFVSRRSDLPINSGPSIKVKSLSDLQGEKQYCVIPNQSSRTVSKVQNLLPSATSSNSLNTSSFVGPNIKDEQFRNPFL